MDLHISGKRLAAGAATGLVAALLAVLPGPAVAATTVAATQDTYTDASQPSTNFGSKPYFRVDGSPVLNGFLKFDVPSGSYSSAVLRFYAESGGSSGVNVRSVSNSTWNESTVTANAAPALGGVIGSSGRITAGTWVSVDVTSAVTRSGPTSFGLSTSGGTAIRLASSEGTNRPQLVLDGGGSTPPPTTSNLFTVSRDSSGTYRAAGADASYTGTLKSVVERAVARIKTVGSAGIVQFTAGDFDLGADFFKLTDVHNVTFAGAGMDATVIRNNNSSAADTEPFNFSGAFGVTIKDMTVNAGGAPRNTSDAMDFDQGNDSIVENVKVTESRGRAIVFDGKNDDWQSLNNTVRNCVISGTGSDGIEFLASSNNTVEGCRISNVGMHGIQITKSSATASGQPNKKSSGNTIRNNTIDEAGQDGIRVHGGDNNVITGNTITNSADVVANHDGIRIGSSDGISCDRNLVLNNVATDNQSTKTQRYGLYISSSLCHSTLVAGNTLTGNRVADIRDLGSSTEIR